MPEPVDMLGEGRADIDLGETRGEVPSRGGRAPTRSLWDLEFSRRDLGKATAVGAAAGATVPGGFRGLLENVGRLLSPDSERSKAQPNILLPEQIRGAELVRTMEVAQSYINTDHETAVALTPTNLMDTSTMDIMRQPDGSSFLVFKIDPTIFSRDMDSLVLTYEKPPDTHPRQDGYKTSMVLTRDQITAFLNAKKRGGDKYMDNKLTIIFANQPPTGKPRLGGSSSYDNVAIIDTPIGEVVGDGDWLGTAIYSSDKKITFDRDSGEYQDTETGWQEYSASFGPAFIGKTAESGYMLSMLRPEDLVRSEHVSTKSLVVHPAEWDRGRQERIPVTTGADKSTAEVFDSPEGDDSSMIVLNLDLEALAANGFDNTHPFQELHIAYGDPNAPGSDIYRERLSIPFAKVVALLNAQNKGKPAAERRLTLILARKQLQGGKKFDNVFGLNMPTSNIQETDKQPVVGVYFDNDETALTAPDSEGESYGIFRSSTPTYMQEFRTK